MTKVNEPRTDEYRRAEKRRTLLRLNGTPAMTDARPVQERIRMWRRHGITLETIAERTGLNIVTIRLHWTGTSPKTGQPIRTVRRATERAVMVAVMTDGDRARYPVCGPQRRLRALSALGYSSVFLGEATGRDFRQIHAFMTGTRSPLVFVRAELHRLIKDLYDTYEYTSPLDAGESQFRVTYASRAAARHGWAPPSCWDRDTIDNPRAIAEWTGKCGTITGYHIHRREVIPFCRPCLDAKNRYNQDGDKRRKENA